MPEYVDITAFREWINWLEERCDSPHADHQTLMFYEIRDMIDNLPKLVRCKDCKHWNNRGCGDRFGLCEAWDGMRKADGYCDCGERKDND